MSYNKKQHPMHCKVCKDAGKTEKEYSSHFVKNQSGAVICPTLLSQECRYCHQMGHTPKWCSLLNQVTKQEAKKAPSVCNVCVPQNVNVNVFSALDIDSSDDESPRGLANVATVTATATATATIKYSSQKLSTRVKPNIYTTSWADDDAWATSDDDDDVADE